MRIKIGIVGGRGVGKTSLIECFCGLSIDKIKGIQLVVDNQLISVKFSECGSSTEWSQYRDRIENEEQDHEDIRLFADDEKQIADCTLNPLFP